LSKAIEVQPDDALAYYNRGCLKRDGKGDLTGALADFNRAVEIRPSSPVFKKARDEMQQQPNK
jgi:tetratricopeptide (TPR) repeat protein